MFDDPKNFICTIENCPEEKKINFYGLKFNKDSKKVLNDPAYKYLENTKYLKDKSEKVFEAIESCIEKMVCASKHKIKIASDSIPKEYFDNIKSVFKNVSKDADYNKNEKAFTIKCYKTDFEKIEEEVAKIMTKIVHKICCYRQEDKFIGLNLKFEYEEEYLSVVEETINEQFRDTVIFTSFTKDGKFELIGKERSLRKVEQQILDKIKKIREDSLTIEFECLDSATTKLISKTCQEINKKSQVVLCEFTIDKKTLNIYFTDKSKAEKAMRNFDDLVRDTKKEKTKFSVELKSDHAADLVRQDQHKCINNLISKFKIECEIKVSKNKVKVGLLGIYANIQEAKKKVEKFIKNCNEQIKEMIIEYAYLPMLFDKNEQLKHEAGFRISDDQPEETWIFYPDNYRCLGVQDNDKIIDMLDQLIENYDKNMSTKSDIYPELNDYISQLIEANFPFLDSESVKEEEEKKEESDPSQNPDNSNKDNSVPKYSCFLEKGYPTDSFKKSINEIIFVFKAQNGNQIFKFKKINNYEISGTEQGIINFNEKFKRITHNEEVIESKEIITSLYTKISEDEVEMMESYLYFEYGCHISMPEVKNAKDIDEDELPSVTIKGFQVDFAKKYIYNHPLLRINKLANGIYPEYWLKTEEVEKEEYKTFKIKIDSKKNKKVYNMVVNTLNQMIDKAKFPNFKILGIYVCEHHYKWHMYLKDLNKTEREFKKNNPDKDAERYLINIYRFQDYEQILTNPSDLIINKSQAEAGDKINYLNNKWLGAQANYFTDSFELASQYPCKSQYLTYHLFLTKCIIGNCKDVAIKDYRVPNEGGVEYDSLSTTVNYQYNDSNNAQVAGSGKVYAFYNDYKTYPEFLIEYKID